MTNIYNAQLDAFDLYHLYIERQQAAAPDQVLPALGHALAGAVGSAVSNISVYPLDLIVTRLQSQRQLRKNSSSSANPSREYRSIQDAFHKIIAHEGGVSALYAGVREDTVKSVADAFLFFLAYNFTRQSRLFRREGQQRLSVLSELSVGFVAGAFSKLITAPIANVVTRLQTSSMAEQNATKRKVDAKQIIKQIREEKGLGGFWAGYSASLVLTLNPSLTFFFFEMFKRLAVGKNEKAVRAWMTFLLAAVSKALASTVTYPFSLAKARIQVSSKVEDGGRDMVGGGYRLGDGKATPASERAAKARRETVFSTVADIARSEGLLALYEGLGGEVLKGFVSHGFTMMAKDMVHSVVIRLYFAVLRLLRRHPEVQQAADRAQEQVKVAVDTARDGAEAAKEKVQEAGRDARHALEQVTPRKD